MISQFQTAKLRSFWLTYRPQRLTYSRISSTASSYFMPSSISASATSTGALQAAQTSLGGRTVMTTFVYGHFPGRGMSASTGMSPFHDHLMTVSSCVYCRVRRWKNWRSPWKNRIYSTTKLRKSLVKPVTRQNISSCLVLPPEIVMHDAFNVILWTSADICVMHDDLGWKNQTTCCIFL